MKIAIAILNWNGLSLLKNQLKGVIEKSITQVLHYYNNSTDDSIEFLRENYPQVQIIELKENFTMEGYNLD